MDISATTALQPTNTGTTQRGSVISSDFETFLRMLTAQARFQDPLEPIDSSEYAAQLAQFSMVEQQVLSNDLLTSLAVQLGSGNMAQLAGWIGLEALTAAPVAFDGAPITVNPNPAAVAEEVFLVVRDANGQEVQRQRLPVSADPVSWAGVSSDGNPFPRGAYTFDVESYAQSELILTESATTYARITEARLDGDETIVILDSGEAVRAADIGGLRAPR